ncbi:MAG TPA: substrate-binding domain-containing protein [Ideonella sp.]|nr:substrate-binding domain-containing protein [Ideonella sp.]
MAASSIDMRSLPRETRHAKRLEVTRLRESGLTYEEIAQQTGLSRTGVFNICKRHATAGEAALHDAPGGRRTGDGRRLSSAQEAAMRGLICAHAPDALGLPGRLWTHDAVRQLVHERLAIALPPRTLGLYLARWGFVAERPVTSAHDNMSSVLKAWYETEFTALLKAAKSGRAEIAWMHSLPASDSVEQGLPMAYTVTHRGEMQWRVYPDGIGAAELLDFLPRLLPAAGKKLLLIADYARLISEPRLKAWQRAHSAAMDIRLLPMQEHTRGDAPVRSRDAAPARPPAGGATIKHVAKRAGVTPTTVSNVLRDRGGVSAKTRELVLNAVKAEGYRPNLTARALVERRSPTLALMLSSITNPFYPEFALATHLAAQQHRRFLLVCNTNHEADGGTRFLQEVAGTLAEGILVANQPALPIDELKAVAAGGTPVVVNVWEHPEESPGIPCVAFDSRHAGETATRHLLALGHSRIGAVIANPRDGIHRGRLRGFLDALDASHHPHDAADERFCDDSIDSGFEATCDLLRARPDLTALFVSNDLPAIGVLNAVAHLGLRVPQDVSVVSITNIALTQHTRPPLTTVGISTVQMATKGVELLLQLIKQPAASPPMVEVDKPSLVMRESTAPPRVTSSRR